MEQGWQCIKCGNVYAPNTPFCLYCWFNKDVPNKIIDQSLTAPITQNKISPIDTQLQPIDTNKITSTNNTSLTIEDLRSNKNLFLEQIHADIPVLDKKPIYPLPDKFPDTKIFIAGIGHSKERAINRKFIIPYILDSIIDFPVQPSKLVRQYFDYIKSNNIQYLLDSGAFSYMNQPKKSFNLQDHLKQYCYYINEFDLTNFIELDLDVFMSIEEVENIRKKIFLETHKQPIVVFHEGRGHDYWLKMCKENDYVAIGGLASKPETNTPQRQQILDDMCNEAHQYNTKVHGLGFTPLALLNSHTMFCDTVDSTSWNTTKHGKSTIINEKGELVKIPLIDSFSASESQEADLKAWTTFAINYKGAYKG